MSEPEGSAYGAGAPSYDNAEAQRSHLHGRIKVAEGIAYRYEQAGDVRRAEKWCRIVDELLDRLLEVRGR